MLLGRKDVADFLETTLRSSAGIRMVRANTVTGRLLVFHEPSVAGSELGHRIRRAVDRATTVASAQETVRLETPERVAAHVATYRPGLAALAGCGLVAALATPLLPSPWIKLGIVVGATVLVVRTAWRASRRTSGVASSEIPRRAIRTIVSSNRRRYHLATALSVAGAALYMVAAACAFSLASVLITGPTAILASLGVVTLAGQVELLGAMGLLSCVLFALVWFVGGNVWRSLARRVQHEWRCDMYAHIQRSQLAYLEGERTTRVARVLTEDIDQFGRYLGNQANYLVRIVTTLALLVGVFIVLAPEIAWIAFLPIPVVAWLSFYYRERVGTRLAAVGMDSSRLSGQLMNNLEASATIKSFGAEDFEEERIRALSGSYGSSSHAVDLRTTAYAQAALGLSMMGLVGVYLVGGRVVLVGALLLGTYNTVIRLPQLFNFQLPGLGEAVEQYQRTVVALGRVLRLREIPVEPSTTGQSLDPATVVGEIVFDRVTFGYPERPVVLDDLSLRIEPRKTTAIVGATGAGKTTIAKLLLRLYDVGSGRVLLDGVDIRELRLTDLRTAIGFVSQEAFLFDGTIGDNITYGTFGADQERMVAAARLAEADVFIADLPNGYDTTVGERGVALSSGQKQRISLARAIVKDAPILILDEATSAVDNETEAAIQHALAEFAVGRTMIVIAHRLSTIRHAHWIYVLDRDGTIIEDGRHADLLENDRLYARLWRLQIGEPTS